ncbi:MAG TPA: type II toxin-antitoxin system HigB family toxin [Phycisphaerae bacterium]|nr:type II toxin-antitoxin system HigB family toxin [Phycisphaerae bacterium]
MRVIAKRMLREYWEKVPATKHALQDWHKRTEAANWKQPQDVKATFGRADPMTINRKHVIVFDIMENRYRLITTITYSTETRMGIVYTREILTHKQYDTDQWKRRIG